VNTRHQRVAGQLHRVLADILRKDINDPRVQDITIMEVRVARDMKSAMVYVAGHTSMDHGPTSGLPEGAIEALTKAEPYIRKMLRPKLGMKYIPYLHFSADEVLEQGARINELLMQLNKKD